MAERRRRWPRRLLIGVARARRGRRGPGRLRVLAPLTDSDHRTGSARGLPRPDRPLRLQRRRSRTHARRVLLRRRRHREDLHRAAAAARPATSPTPSPSSSRRAPTTASAPRSTSWSSTRRRPPGAWAADGSLTLRSQEKQEKVPGFDVAGLTTCDPGTIIAAGATETTVRCALVAGRQRSVAEDRPGRHRSGRAGRGRRRRGTTVATRHVVLALDATGDLSGHWNEEYWLTTDLLAVRTRATSCSTARARFDETTSLTLRDLRPQT